MKIKLTYFNLVLLVGYFGIEFSRGSVNPVLSIGLVIALWYNWETSKRLKGLPSTLNKINVLMGVVVLLFAALIASEGFHKIMILDHAGNLAGGLPFLAMAQITLGFSNLLITAKTITIYWKTKTL
jgi:hypothetical protein